MPNNYIRNKDYILRGSRCYGISVSDTRFIYIHGAHSWPVKRMRKFLVIHLKDQFMHIVSIKRITNFNDNFFKLKVLANKDTTNNIANILKTKLPHTTITHFECSRKNHKYSFSTLKKKIQQSSNDSSSSLNNFNTSIHIYYSDSHLIASIHFLIIFDNSNLNTNDQAKSFPFCLSWNTNGWNDKKKLSIEFFIAIYKLLFLCFQETGNGSGSTSQYPYKVILPNYKYFFKKADDKTPGKRGLFLGYHKSCQASLDSFSFEYIISLSNNIRINSISNIDILGNRKIVNRYRIYIFLIGGRDYGFSDRINNSPYKKEWECLFKCQTESGTYSKSPFLLRSATLLNDIMPVVCKGKHILFNKFKTNLSRNVNADNTVGQSSRANADPISDPSGIG
ncbi:hypothetical protein BCR32DRAFT_292677 [Anaeromyces robustus]|uniref:Uncharacterized protein n=1 Tax=Anaeromyces robustus TaxID=1754192 RepID=A0A1Y1XAI4_9FUNG|nr:hypothetical protein BCR32DRAFT_292677 [Anaeromyces robustus]|eukprot:ORX82364.1 hypothetical protein BCR32DRAFT_292677 [Anaeromyces robustus]